MGLREWWDKLMGKNDNAAGERGYNAGAGGTGSAPEPASDPATNRDAYSASASTTLPETDGDTSSDTDAERASTDPAGNRESSGGDGSSN